MNIIINNNISINLLILILGYLALRLQLNKTFFLSVSEYKEGYGLNIKRGFIFLLYLWFIYIYIYLPYLFYLPWYLAHKLGIYLDVDF